MSATVTITVHQDRKQSATLTLIDERGATLFSCLCLARSAGHTSNPSRDPLHYRGDTPIGRYALTHVSRLPQPVTGIGTLWCPLDPNDFYDSQARRAELNGRTGLGIHAGRGNVFRKPTHGCVRLLDKDMEDFARIAGKTRFTVEIKEV